jgi:hypothetical protein
MLPLILIRFAFAVHALAGVAFVDPACFSPADERCDP